MFGLSFGKFLMLEKYILERNSVALFGSFQLRNCCNSMVECAADITGEWKIGVLHFRPTLSNISIGNRYDRLLPTVFSNVNSLLSDACSLVESDGISDTAKSFLISKSSSWSESAMELARDLYWISDALV